MKKRIIFFSILVLCAYTFVDCDYIVDTDHAEGKLDFKYIPGEVLVGMADGFNVIDLRERLQEIGLTLNRHLGGGYVVDVPEGDEMIWVERLQEEPEVEVAKLNIFGYSYNVLYQDRLPAIRNDSLIVTVGYGGCHGNHEFSMEKRIVGSSTAEIWLLKKTPDQLCRAIFEEQRTFIIPPEIQGFMEFILLAPVDDKFELSGRK